MGEAIKLTKADTRALWRAVDDMRLMFYAGTMKADPPLSQEVIQVEREKLLQAKRALRKVYALRKQQSAAELARAADAGGKEGKP